MESGGTTAAEAIYTAYDATYGYRLKEIGDFLGVHYSTVSRRVKEGEEGEKTNKVVPG